MKNLILGISGIIRSQWPQPVSISAKKPFLKFRMSVLLLAFSMIGKVVLAQYFRGPFSQILALIGDEHKSLDEAEKTVLPVSHAQIGGHLAQKWNLPNSLAHAIKYHHFATNLSLSMIVHVADIVVDT